MTAFFALLVPLPQIAQTLADQTDIGSIRGTVTDTSGAVVPGAIVTLQDGLTLPQRTTITDETGSFQVSAVKPGNYTLTIAGLGFIDQKTNLSVVADNPPLAPIVLEIAPAVSKVDVTLPPHELAAEQVRAAEKQRLFAVFPNFFVSYQSNPAPLTAAQKFQLGWKSILDPAAFLASGITAGIEQAHNTNREFGQGMQGFAKRFGADYADTVSGVLIGNILTTSIFHQDPRYFYKGNGTVKSRLLYAIATAFIRKGDNGHWQPDYSGVLGGIASGEISTLYYPATSRPGLQLVHNVLLGFAGRAADHLMQEFVYSKLTTHVPKTAGQSRPVLPEGTAVSLISIEDLRLLTPQDAKPITFVLAKNLELDGVVVAQAGSRATAEATYGAGPPASAGAGTTNLSLENAALMIGNAKVALRSSEEKAGGAGLEYRWLENSGRIMLVLYLAQNFSIPPVQ